MRVYLDTPNDECGAPCPVTIHAASSSMTTVKKTHASRPLTPRRYHATQTAR